MNWTETELFRLTFAEQIAESKLCSQRIVSESFRSAICRVQIKNDTSLFGLSSVSVQKFRLSERLIQKWSHPMAIISCPSLSCG